MTGIVAIVLLILIALIGILLAVLQLPGTWLILAAAVAFDGYYGWDALGWRWLAALAVVAVLAEILDTLASVVAARRAGASRRAMVGAVIGGFVGMVLLSLPVPVIGTILGGLLGCFLGGLMGEMTIRNDLAAGARVGLFATMGRVFGIVGKTAAAMAIAAATVSLAVRALW